MPDEDNAALRVVVTLLLAPVENHAEEVLDEATLSLLADVVETETVVLAGYETKPNVQHIATGASTTRVPWAQELDTCSVIQTVQRCRHCTIVSCQYTFRRSHRIDNDWALY